MLGLWAMTMARAASSGDSLITDYQRGLGLDVWRTGFLWESRLGSSTRLHVSETASSSRLEMTDSEAKWKDEERLAVELEHSLSPYWTWAASGSHVFFFDRQSGFSDQIRTVLVGTGPRYARGPIQIPIFAGYKQDHRFGITDQGLNVRFGIECGDCNWAGYTHTGAATFESDRLNKRTNRSTGVTYQVSREFYEQTADTLRIAYRNQRRDYYLSPAGDIESRREETAEAENGLTYRLGDRLRCRVSGGITLRSLIIDPLTGGQTSGRRERRDFSAEGTAGLEWTGRKLSASISYFQSGEDQRYRSGAVAALSGYGAALAAPDNQSELVMLTFHMAWRPNGGDSVLVYSNLQRFRYDTPDPVNDDDRDEFRFHFQVSAFHRFSAELAWTGQAEANLVHMVYIFKSRSAENNWTRIFRLNQAVRWTPSPNVSFTQTAEVLANYAAYDYEAFFTQVRSFLFRQFGLEDSLTVRLTPRTSISFQYRHELDETGKFLWDEWAEQPMMDRISRTAEAEFHWRPWTRLEITPGYTFFSRRSNRSMLPAVSDPYARFLNEGPTCEIRYRGERVHAEFSLSTIATRTAGATQRMTRADLGMGWAW